MRADRHVVLVLFLLLAVSCSSGNYEIRSQHEGLKSNIQMTSSAFRDGGDIPSRYTCDGENVSPPLRWDGAPSDTRTFALIADDPDAPGGTWVHWVLYNIPGGITELAEAGSVGEATSEGALNGTNDFKQLGYGAPCPPPGRPHRYFFKLYALDAQVDLEAGATEESLLSAMEGHVVGEAQVVGKYQRR